MAYQNATAIPRPELSAFLEEATKQQPLIGGQVAPMKSVNSVAGRYPRLNKKAGNLLKAEAGRRGPTGTYDEIARSTEWDTYQCHDYGLTERIDDVITHDMKSFFDHEALTARLLMRANLLAYEKRVAGLFMDTANWESHTITVDTAYTEANIDTIDFAKDMFGVETVIRQRGEDMNTVIMNKEVFNRIRRSTKLQSYLYGVLGAGTGKRLIRPGDLSSTFGIEKLLLASSSYDQAPPNADPSMTDIWSPNYIWFGRTEAGDFSLGGAARTLVWAADVPGGMWATESWRDEDRRGDMLRVRTHCVEKVIDKNCGVLLDIGWA